jgi:hypothetical protein
VLNAKTGHHDHCRFVKARAHTHHPPRARARARDPPTKQAPIIDSLISRFFENAPARRAIS